MSKTSANKILLEGNYHLEKYPGKGGWTYVTIPAFGKTQKNPFALQRTNVIIDGHEIKDAGIWKTKKGDFFLPVKAEIRKKIGKEHGDAVHIIIPHVPSALETIDEILICIKEDADAFRCWKKNSAG